LPGVEVLGLDVTGAEAPALDRHHQADEVHLAQPVSPVPELADDETKTPALGRRRNREGVGLTHPWSLDLDEGELARVIVQRFAGRFKLDGRGGIGLDG